MLHLAVFASGRGSNVRAIHSSIEEGNLDARIVVLVSSRPDAGVIPFARDRNIPVFVEPPVKDRMPDYPHLLIEELTRRGADFIALCGYMKLLPAEVVASYRNRITNIHPALLPSFGGKGMYGPHVHRAVIESGAKVSGATVHLVSEEYDRGPIVMQGVVPVEDDDSPESLAARVLTVEHAIYARSLQLFAEDRIRVEQNRTRTLPPLP